MVKYTTVFKDSVVHPTNSLLNSTFLSECCTLSPAPSPEDVPGMFCYHLLSALLQAGASLFPPLTHSPLRYSPIFATRIIQLLFNFLFPNHGVNSAHFYALSYFIPFKNFDYSRSIVTSSLSHQRPCISSA